MRSLIVAAYILAFPSIGLAQRIQPGSGVQLFWSRAGPSGLCVTSGGTGDGAPVVIHQCYGAPAADQTWLVRSGSAESDTGTATQIRIHGSKCLDVREGVNADGTKLQLWECNDGNPNQQWIHDWQHQTIRWGNTGKCLDLTAGNGTNGNQLQVWTCNQRTNQNQWWNSITVSITPGPNQAARIQNDEPPRQGPCLMAANNSDGAAVITQNCNLGSAESRAWVAVQGAAPGGVGTGPVTQIRIFGNKCLDVTAGRAVDGTQLQIWTCGDNNRNQNWHLNGDGRIVWEGSNFCVDLTEGNRGNGTRTQIWTCWPGNLNQAWHEISAA